MGWVEEQGVTPGRTISADSAARFMESSRVVNNASASSSLSTNMKQQMVYKYWGDRKARKRWGFWTRTKGGGGARKGGAAPPGGGGGGGGAR